MIDLQVHTMAEVDENLMKIKVTPIMYTSWLNRGRNERIVVTIEPDFMKNALTLKTVYFSD